MSKISLILVLLFSLPLGACAKEIPNKEIQEILDIEPVTKTNVQTEQDIPKSVEEGKKEKLKPSVLENSLQNTALANSEQGIAQSEVSSTPLVKVTEKKVIAAAESPKTARVDKRVQTQTQEKTAAQEMLNLDQYKGKVVYLDFWASWCEPCQQTFPWMDAMQKKYPDDIVFIAVNFGENPEDTQEFLKRFPADIKFVYDPLLQIAREYGVPGLPYSFIYGRQGDLLGKHAGFAGGSEINLEAALQNLFASGQ